MSKILLLGSGYPKKRLASRNRISGELRKLGHNPIIMEYTKQTNDPLHEIFYKLAQKEYKGIVAIYFDNSAQDAVNFELGFLTHRQMDKENKSKKKEFWDSFYILTHNTLPEKKLTSYLREGLFVNVIRDIFENENEIVRKIDRFVNSR